MSAGPDSLFESLGETGVRRLVAAFYQQVPTDSILGPMYPPHDLAAAERRLGDFLIYRFGGPQTYITDRGPPRLRIRHAPFAVDQAARDRWVELMDRAIASQTLSEEIAIPLRDFLQSTATFLINR